LFTVGTVKAHAGILYSQPSNNVGFFYSQNDTNGVPPANATTYDNFTLGTSSTVANVAWTGGFLPGADTTNITSFTLTFYNDNAGQPGSILATRTILGNAGQTFAGNDLLQDNVYNFNANVSTPTFLAGTQYWLSIVANRDSGGLYQYGWENSSVGDGVGYQTLFGTTGPITSDSAFTLSDVAAVPEPSTLVMASMLFGMIGVFSTYKRLKRNTLAA